MKDKIPRNSFRFIHYSFGLPFASYFQRSVLIVIYLLAAEHSGAVERNRQQISTPTTAISASAKSTSSCDNVLLHGCVLCA